MNRSYIEIHLAVDRYLRGDLSDDEAAEFEERLVWDRELMDEVDLATHLREGIRAELTRNEAAGSGHRGVVDRMTGLFHVPAYAAAASFLVAVGLTSLILTGNRPDAESAHAGPGLATEIVPLFATRSTAASTVVIPEHSWSVILVDAPAGYEKFRVSIHPQGEQDSPIWSGEDLRPTYPDSLAVGMPGSLLAEGDYVLILDGIVTGSDDFERIQAIPFLVTRP